MNREAETLTQAIDAFYEETGLEIKIKERQVKLNNNFEVDAIVELEGQPWTTLFAEIKNWVAQTHIGAIVNQMMQLPDPKILIADYVNKNLAQRLKERGIQFIDTAGNAYIKELPVYIYVRGNDRQTNRLTVEHRMNDQLAAETGEYNTERMKPATGRAFTPTGLKVVYAYLTEPEAIGAPYRYIAGKADVALGTVGLVVNDLKTRGLVLERGKKGKKKKEIIAYRKLLDLWTEAYVLNLRPKQVITELYHEDPYWWQDFEIRALNGQWGGETAAAKLTDNLRPTTTTIYLRGHITPLVQQARLHQRKNATDIKVEILRPFWPLEEVKDKAQTVNALLVYADLVNTADTRNIETAHLILERYIDQYI